jgi:hypothetical protein
MSSIHPLLKKIIAQDMERPLFNDIRNEYLPEWARANRSKLATLSKQTQCSIVKNPIHPEYLCGKDSDGVCANHNISHLRD